MVRPGVGEVISNQKGMALLVTLMTLALLVVVTVQYWKDNWYELQVSHNYKSRQQLIKIAESGINLGLAILEQDGQNEDFDTLVDIWAKLPKSEMSGLFDNGELEVTVKDLSGRIQVNSLGTSIKSDVGQERNGTEVQEQIEQVLVNLLLLEPLRLEEENQAQEIVDGIRDWVDEDDVESDQGAEESYYRSLKRPYGCRNASIQNIEELLLIKGIRPEVFFGASERAGLAEYLTVYGDDAKINLNTASLEVIKALDLLITDELMQNFNDFRNDEENRDLLSRLDWYKNVSGWPGDIVLNEELTTVQSHFFQIQSVARMNEVTVKIVTDVHRLDKNPIRILGRFVE